MTESARLQRLERKVERLARAIARERDPEAERERARRLIIRHLKTHAEIDGVDFAAKHQLVFNDVEEAVQELEKMGTLGPVEE